MTDIPATAVEAKKTNERANSTSGDWTSHLNVSEMWREHPVATGVAATAAAAAAAYATYRFGPAALRALPEMGTAMRYGTAATAAGVGLYGAGNLFFNDGANTLSGNSWTEHGANFLRSASDVAVVGGATTTGIGILTRNPGLTAKGLGAIAAGGSTHFGVDYLAPRTELLTASSVAFGHTQDWSADSPVQGARKLKADNDASTLDRRRMPPTIVCDENGCYDAEALAAKGGVNHVFNGKKPFSVYRIANDESDSFTPGAYKIREWKTVSAGGEADAITALRAEKAKLDIGRMLMDDQLRYRQYSQDITVPQIPGADLGIRI